MLKLSRKMCSRTEVVHVDHARLGQSRKHLVRALSGIVGAGSSAVAGTPDGAGVPYTLRRSPPGCPRVAASMMGSVIAQPS